MNSLTRYINTHKLDWKACMNALQLAGVVSDNCVEPEDVASRDTMKAIAFLEKWRPK